MKLKINRLKSLAKGSEQQVKDESIQDTLMDLANYSIMTIIELSKEANQNYLPVDANFPITNV